MFNVIALTLIITGETNHPIEEFYNKEDGSDWLPAFKRAMNSIPTDVDYTGFTLLFGPNKYVFSNTASITGPMSLRGDGGMSRHNATRLVFPTDDTGIWIRQTAFGHRTAGVRIEGMSILGCGGKETSKICPEASNFGAHGILAEARVELRDLYIAFFSGSGLVITSTLSENNSANMPSAIGLWSEFNAGHGMHIESDASVGFFALINCSRNGMHGIFDSSYYGQGWISTHANGNGGSNYYTDSPGNRGVWIAPYSEGYQIGRIRHRQFVVGGHYQWDPNEDHPASIFATEQGRFSVPFGIDVLSDKNDQGLRIGLPKGGTDTKVTIQTATENPAATTCRPGDIKINRKPEVGAVWGWQCVRTTTRQRWQSLGRVQPDF